MAAVNDATKQKIGDIYQYFIALFDCFSLKKGESMLIETEGDVSIVSHSGQNRIQKEIKHHLGKRNLSDRDEDFWNTLDNWCKNKHRTATFEKLIFYTTSGISKNSAFYNWNTVDTDARYRLLKDCGEERRMRESSFRQHYDNIFSANTLTQKELMDILGKIEIWSDQSVISEIDQIFAEASRHIPLENRRLYIEFLLGHIMAKVADPPHKWHVSFDDFEQMVIDATGRFAKSDHVYLPSDTGGEPSPEDCAALQEKVFVKEIERIEYDQVIHSAIDDYWRTHTQVLRSAQSNILFMASLPAYKDDLKRRLDGEKRQASRRMRGQDHCAHIDESQDMYDRATSWPATDFGNVVGNTGYFQNGIIHEIVDEQAFKWSLEEVDEH